MGIKCFTCELMGHFQHECLHMGKRPSQTTGSESSMGQPTPRKLLKANSADGTDQQGGRTVGKYGLRQYTLVLRVHRWHFPEVLQLKCINLIWT